MPPRKRATAAEAPSRRSARIKVRPSNTPTATHPAAAPVAPPSRIKLRVPKQQAKPKTKAKNKLLEPSLPIAAVNEETTESIKAKFPSQKAQDVIGTVRRRALSVKMGGQSGQRRMSRLPIFTNDDQADRHKAPANKVNDHDRRENCPASPFTTENPAQKYTSRKRKSTSPLTDVLDSPAPIPDTFMSAQLSDKRRGNSSGSATVLEDRIRQSACPGTDTDSLENRHPRTQGDDCTKWTLKYQIAVISAKLDELLDENIQLKIGNDALKDSVNRLEVELKELKEIREREIGAGRVY